MWQRCLHTFHFPSSLWRFQRSPDHSLSNPDSSYRYYGSQGRGGKKKKKKKTEQISGGRSFHHQNDLLISPPTGKLTFSHHPQHKNYLAFFFPSLWLHILSFLHTPIKNRRGFQRPGCFIFFGQGNRFLSSNYFISYENSGWMENLKSRTYLHTVPLVQSLT